MKARKLEINKRQARRILFNVRKFVMTRDIETQISVRYYSGKSLIEMEGTLLNIAIWFRNQDAACALLDMGCSVGVGSYASDNGHDWWTADVHPIESASSFGMVRVAEKLLQRGVDFGYEPKYDNDGLPATRYGDPLGISVLSKPVALATLRKAGWKDESSWRKRNASQEAEPQESFVIPVRRQAGAPDSDPDRIPF